MEPSREANLYRNLIWRQALAGRTQELLERLHAKFRKFKKKTHDRYDPRRRGYAGSF
jgi:hypothetical protein